MSETGYGRTFDDIWCLQLARVEHLLLSKVTNKRVVSYSVQHELARLLHGHSTVSQLTDPGLYDSVDRHDFVLPGVTHKTCQDTSGLTE